MNERKDMSGILFVNDKGDNPKRPDYRGEIVINGFLYKLSGWVREGKKGQFISLAAQVAETEAKAQAQETGDEPF